jgi:hypothetical protein
VKLLNRILLALALSIIFPVIAAAQYTSGLIAGIIQAEDGSPVPGVKIDLIHGGATAQTISDSEGRFTFFSVNPGQVVVQFEHGTMPSVMKYNTGIHPGQTLRLNIKAWKIEEVAGTPAPWRTEKVLAEEWIDSFPNANNIDAFLNHTEPSVVAERYDVAGMHGHRQLLLGIRGSSLTQNATTINGINVTSPDGSGMLAFPDITTMKSIAYTVGDSIEQHMGTGAHLSMMPKTGGRKIHGQSRLFFQSGALQNTNPTERLRFFGITDSDERWHHFINADFQIGGPLGGAPWTYFGAFSLRDQDKYIREHTLPVSATVGQETFHLTGNPSERDQVSFYWAGQQISEPQANASPQITREASLDQDQRYQTLQAAWIRSISPKSLIDARLGVVSGDIRSRPQPEINAQNREELFPGFALYGAPNTPSYLEMVEMLSNTVSGAPSLISNSDAFTFEAKFGFSTIQDSFGKSSHRIAAGAAYRRSILTQQNSAIDNVNLLFFERMPESVRLLNTPVKTRDRIHHLQFHGADSISFARLSIGFGAYASFANGANILDSDISANSLTWKNLSGRIGIAFSPWNNRRLILRAGLARIFDQPLTRTWSAVNASGFGVERHSWIDENGDLQFQPGEEAGILKVYGAPYSRLDPDLRNPHMNEATLGFGSEITSGISVQVFGFRRTEKNLISLVNEGVPFSSYTPVQVWDPGPDGDLTGGGDGSLVTAYNQDRSTLGQDRYLLTNPEGHTGSSEGFELKLGFVFGRFQAEASIMRYREVAATAPGIAATENDTSALLGVFDDPNKAILARGSTYFDRGTVGRLWATYDLFWGIHSAAIISYQDGLPFGRYLPVKDFNQGVFGILMRQRGPGESGSVGGYMTAHYRNLDLRISREFSWSPGRLSAVIDVFNIENRAGALIQTDVTAPTHLYRIPLRFQTPRSIQLGIHYRW